MAKVLGLDLGTTSIGWALVDTDKNKLLNAGVRIFPDSHTDKRVIARQIRRIKNKHSRNPLINETLSFDKKNLALKILTVFTILTTLLSFINTTNWQFWLNISMTFLVALLTISHQDKK